MEHHTMSFEVLLILGLLFGVGFGFFVQRSGLCFAQGISEIFIGRGRRIARLFAVIFVITSIGFLLSSFISPQLGLKPIGQIRGYGFFNILAGMAFGAGILLNGGCILGTLRQLGEGNLLFLVVLVSFIPGMALVVHGINPLLKHTFDVKAALIPQLLNLPMAIVTGALALGAIVLLIALRPKNQRTAKKQ